MPKGNCEFRATGGQYFSTVIVHLGLFSIFSFGLYLPWALVRLFKLKASHTTIQGKEIDFSGNGGQLFGLLLLITLLTMITLGLYGPWGMCRILRWKADNTLVGGIPSRFSGTGGGLFFLYLIHLFLLPMITFGFYYLVGMYRFYAWKEEHTLYGGKPTSFGAGLGGYIKISLLTWVLNSVTFALFSPWALCMLYRWQMGGLVVGDKDLVDHFPKVRTSWRAVLITLLMGLLVVASLGFLVLEEIKFHMQALSKGSFNQKTVLKSKIRMDKPLKAKINAQKAEGPAFRSKSSPKMADSTAAKPVMAPAGKSPPGIEDVGKELKKIDLFIQENPGNADARYNRAFLYAAQGDYARAQKDYTEAIAMDPDNAAAYYNRGLLRIQLKKYNMAVSDFDKAISLNPGLKDAYCNRGNAYFALEKFSSAIEDYAKAIEMDPEDGDIFYNRGMAYSALGQKNRAAADFKRAFQLGQKKAEKYLKQPTDS